MKPKLIYCITFLIAFMGLSDAILSQAAVEAPSPRFLILIETTKDGVRLTSQEGCAWTELNISFKKHSSPSINQYGMVTKNEENPTKDKDLAGFLFTITKTKKGFALEGKEGTAWLNLDFDCKARKCAQYINFNGMVEEN